MKSHREVLKYLRESNPHVKVTRDRKGVYKMYFMYDKEKAAHLWFTLDSEQMYIKEGQTYWPHERKGIGAFLRALATKAGKIYGTKVGKQIGVHAVVNPKNVKPASTRILERNIGWTAYPLPNLNIAGMKSYAAVFDYSSNNISKANAIIKKWYEPPPPKQSLIARLKKRLKPEKGDK